MSPGSSRCSAPSRADGTGHERGPGLTEWIIAVGCAAALAIWSARVAQREAYPERPTGTTPLEPSAPRSITLIIVLAWAYAVVTSFIGLLQLGRQGNGIGTVAVVTSTQAHLSTALSAAIAFLCFRLILLHLDRPPATSPWRLSAFLLPWLAIEVIGAIHAGYVSGRQFLLYPVIALTFWLVSPSMRALTALGYLVILTAGFSLGFGLVSRLAFIDAGAAGTDKAIIGHGPLLLAGPYNASNGLGLSLALGVPAVTLVPKQGLRALGLVLVFVALLWSASRTSILAATVATSLYLVSRVATARGVQLLGLGAVLVGVLLVVWTPLRENDPYAFSRRGMIWIARRDVWHRHLWFGAGPRYYERPNDLGFYALYGHNLLLDTLVRAGLIGAAAVGAWYAVLVRRATRLGTATSFPILFAVAFIFTSWLEVPIMFGNLGLLGFTAWIPSAVIFFAPEPGLLRGERNGDP
jgi:hypothetical protein